MSGKRIEIVEPCEHGYVESHYWHPRKKIALSGVPENRHCEGGSRCVLDPDEYFDVDPGEIVECRGILIPLDALSDHTEGTP